MNYGNHATTDPTTSMYHHINRRENFILLIHRVPPCSLIFLALGFAISPGKMARRIACMQIASASRCCMIHSRYSRSPKYVGRRHELPRISKKDPTSS